MRISLFIIHFQRRRGSPGVDNDMRLCACNRPNVCAVRMSLLRRTLEALRGLAVRR